MAAATQPGAPPTQAKHGPAASGRPVGVSATSYGEAAGKLLEHGYEPLPIRVGAKRPAVDAWTTVTVDAAAIECWSRSFPGHGVGLRTGALVAVDIDILDPDLAHRIEQIARTRLGDTLIRVGLWPKRLLLFHTDAPFAKMSVRGIEVLGQGQQVVAFGAHPDTGQPYYWPEGETPLDVPLGDLPRVDEDACRDMLGEALAWLPAHASTGGSRRPGQGGTRSSAPVRDAQGLVIDGRDGWLSSIAYHAVHDALTAGQPLDHADLTDAVWRRFAATADVSRPRKDGRAPYGPADAGRKVADKLRLHAEARLPPRGGAAAEAACSELTGTASEARKRLDAAFGEACAAVEAWHAGRTTGPSPQIGIRATVGLGKSAAARRHLLPLQQRLAAVGAPSRILVFTPSHALAEETALVWRNDGARVAVLRGYEAREPGTGLPMCRDLEAVRAAVAARVDVHSAACESTAERSCRYFTCCRKQANRMEVRDADVVVAPYDALFTGFAMDPATVGAVLVDEGCWARAPQERGDLWVESLGSETGWVPGRSGGTSAADTADLVEIRSRAATLLRANGPGALCRDRLRQSGLTAQDCLTAARLEERRLCDPGLYPGMPKQARGQAMQRVHLNEAVHRAVALWHALRAMLTEGPGLVQLRLARNGLHEIVVSRVMPVHRHLRSPPVLHLDATLRAPLARTVLPRLEVTEIAAAAPHMEVRLVTGSFGKRSLCPDPRAGEGENRRRANRLAECVDYIRWHACRHAPGKVLVITYKDCETAFLGIPGTDVAHFNAVAGLDCFRDVRLLAVVGRPLPAEHAVAQLCGAFFGRLPAGGYHGRQRGVRMRDGTSRTVRVVEHSDEQAEVLRAAICDDELVQAVGRGRGVNRSAADPLEVHILADVALPLVHDRVLAWEMAKPDILQRMLLAGVAVDSPGDAAALHPELFAGAEQAKKAFQRDGFGGQNPLRNPYWEMSPKSAKYRRPGRGRSWQRAWWIGETADTARVRLEAVLGPLAAWEA